MDVSQRKTVSFADTLVVPYLAKAAAGTSAGAEPAAHLSALTVGVSERWMVFVKEDLNANLEPHAECWKIIWYDYGSLRLKGYSAITALRCYLYESCFYA